MSAEAFLVLLGAALGSALTYIVKEAEFAFREKPSDLHAKLSKCTIEAVRRNAELDLDGRAPEELVRAIASGLKTIPSRNREPGKVHSDVRD